MKNKATDVADHLMMQLERLGDEQLSTEALAAEIRRANAISSVAREWTSLQRTAIDAAKAMRNTNMVPVAFAPALVTAAEAGAAKPLAIGRG